MDFDWTTLAAFGFGLGVLYFLARLLFLPLRIIVKLLYNGILGGIMIGLINLAGAYLNFYIPLNPINALIAGFLGIPGVILVAVLRYLTIN